MQRIMTMVMTLMMAPHAHIPRSKHTNQPSIFLRFELMFQSFLKTMSKYYNIVIFSGSNENYGKAVCHYLDPNKKYI